MTVTKQQQLEYAAKHIEKWKSGYDYVVVEETTDGRLYIRWPSICTSGVTKKEWQQERDKMQKQPEADNSWHDSCELPPVGCMVDVTGNDVAYGYGESKCEVLAHVEDCAVIRMSFGLGCFVAEVLSPSRTEREKAIDEMLLAIDHIKEGNFETFIGALYDAGYRKVNS